eukprot:448413_1
MVLFKKYRIITRAKFSKTMETSELVEHSIFAIILTSLTIAAFIILYHLHRYLCCCDPPKEENENSDHEIEPPTNSPSCSRSKSNSNSNHSSNSQNPSNQIHGFFKCTTITTCIFFGIVCVSVTIDRILLLIFLKRKTSSIMFIIWPFYFIGHIILSLIFIARLYQTFKGSTFAYSKCTINILVFTWILMPFFSFLSIVISVIPQYDFIGYFCGTLVIVVDIILSFILWYLYLKKLFVLICGDDPFFKSLMTKYTLLYTLCFLSTFTSVTILSIQSVSFAMNSTLMTTEQTLLPVSIDSFVNILCLWLNLSFAEPWYHKLCKYLDNKCHLFCKRCTKKTVSNQQMIELEIKTSESNASDMNTTIH